MVEERAGIQVVADAQAWTGSPDVLDDLVPIWVSVTNRSGRNVYVSPVDIELVGPKLRVRAELPLALDPRPLQTADPERRQTADPQPLQTTVGLDPTVPDDRVSVVGDQIDVRSEESRLRDELRQRGLRNGELGSGGTASGFVYFERASWDTGRLELQVTVRERSGGTLITTVRLPFAVI